MSYFSDSNDIWNPHFAHLLLDAMAEGVFTLNAAGVIQSWNPSMKKISGYSAAEAIGKTCRMLNFSSCFNSVCPKDAQECGIFQNGAVAPTECKLMHKGGHYLSVIKNARLVKNGDGTIMGVVETLTDLTELTIASKI